MDETYGAYVDDKCYDIHDYDDDTDHDTDDDTGDDTDDDTTDDTDDADGGGRGNLYPIKAQGLKDQDLVRARMSILEEIQGVILRQSKAPLEIFNCK